jgi:hypothetical protein
MPHEFNEQSKFMNRSYIKDCSIGELLWFIKECINLIESKYVRLTLDKNNK